MSRPIVYCPGLSVSSTSGVAPTRRPSTYTLAPEGRESTTSDPATGFSGVWAAAFVGGAAVLFAARPGAALAAAFVALAAGFAGVAAAFAAGGVVFAALIGALL
jgi:hypothetical protein